MNDKLGAQNDQFLEDFACKNSKIYQQTMSNSNQNKRSAHAAGFSSIQKRQTRSRTKKRLDATMHNAFSIVIQENILHWSDGVALGSTCKEARKTWKEMGEDQHLLPLLEELEAIFPPRKDDDYVEEEDCHILRKRLLPGNYSSFSVEEKCIAMTLLLQKLVGYLQNCSGLTCLDDPSNSTKNRQCDISRFLSWVHLHDPEQRFLRAHPCRSALALNIALFSRILWVLKQGQDSYADIASAGSSTETWYRLSCMLPLRDEDLVKHIRNAYPSSEKLEILGPVAGKVVLMAPFFRWVTPSVTSDDNDGTCFDDLPTPLEEMNEDVIRAFGMGRWL